MFKYQLLSRFYRMYNLQDLLKKEKSLKQPLSHEGILVSLQGHSCEAKAIGLPQAPKEAIN